MKVTNADVIEVIKSLGTLAINPNGLAADKSFKEQGIDSLDVMSIVLNLEDKFGLKILDDDVAKLTSVERISEYLSSRLDA